MPERSSSDDKLDEVLDETFPASDAPANTVETGVRVGEVPSSSGAVISNNAERSRLELTIDGRTAFLDYRQTPETFTILHTEVPVELRGRHHGEQLVEAARRACGRRVRPRAPICEGAGPRWAPLAFHQALEPRHVNRGVRINVRSPCLRPTALRPRGLDALSICSPPDAPWPSS